MMETLVLVLSPLLNLLDIRIQMHASCIPTKTFGFILPGGQPSAPVTAVINPMIRAVARRCKEYCLAISSQNGRVISANPGPVPLAAAR